MHIIDIIIFVCYFLLMIGVGLYFFRKNKSTDEYYVGDRKIKSWHIGLSVVATDVGGGFSIGLGGLGFAIGISGSWMLFTGLLGAWLSAIFLIPKVYPLSSKLHLLTFPQLFLKLSGKKVFYAAAVITTVGYIGFTSSQILAGAKLASAAFSFINLKYAVILMGVIVVAYTSLGGIKAVIYTDTIQWIILLVGLILVGIPLGYITINKEVSMFQVLPPQFFSFTNISWKTFFNWLITILPIWFVGMTLYQRIYASKDVNSAKKAWYLAGILEYPFMAFLGVVLGLFARVGAEIGLYEAIGGSVANMDPEMGLPLFLKTILPIGFLGVMLAAYFSAIMSTADSCLIAASGAMTNDLLGIHKDKSLKAFQIITLIIGVVSIYLAMSMTNVLEMMLYSYSIMVSGLLIPVLAIFYSKHINENAIFWSMVTGGSVTLILSLANLKLFGLDENFYAIGASLIVYILFSRMVKPVKSFVL